MSGGGISEKSAVALVKTGVVVASCSAAAVFSPEVYSLLLFKSGCLCRNSNWCSSGPWEIRLLILLLLLFLNKLFHMYEQVVRELRTNE